MTDLEFVMALSLIAAVALAMYATGKLAGWLIRRPFAIKNKDSHCPLCRDGYQPTDGVHWFQTGSHMYMCRDANRGFMNRPEVKRQLRAARSMMEYE